MQRQSFQNPPRGQKPQQNMRIRVSKHPSKPSHQTSRKPSSMEAQTHLREPFQFQLDYPDYSTFSEDELLILKPASWFIQFVAVQLDFISDCLFSVASVFITFCAMVSETLIRASEAKKRTEETVNREIAAVAQVPSKVAEGGGLVLRKLGFGFLGATYMGLVLVLVMVLASFIGVVVVKLWVEEPVFMKEPLYFDYTEVQPSATVSFGNLRGKKRALPAGHIFFVSVALLMPESDYNQQIGMFQLTAEVISSVGDIREKSSQPCMLRFSSFPVRLIRTFIMGVPLLLGITGETQKIHVQILKYRETNLEASAIRVQLKPRAGTFGLPELYSAELLMNSQLPRSKEFVRNWKWTFYVWVSLYVYIMLLTILICCCKQVVFPVSLGGRSWRGQPTETVAKRGREDDEFSDMLRKWRQSRSKRRVWEQRGVSPESVQCSASSTITVEETGDMFEDSSKVAGF